jgi:hypothetical protein
LSDPHRVVRRPQRVFPGRGRRHAAHPGRPRRRRQAGKRGGGVRTIVLEGDAPALGPDPDLVLDVDEALARLAIDDPASAEVACYRLFAGLSIDETAEALGISRRIT